MISTANRVLSKGGVKCQSQCNSCEVIITRAMNILNYKYLSIEQRSIAICVLSEEGYSIEDIVKRTGVHRKNINTTVERYKNVKFLKERKGKRLRNGNSTVNIYQHVF